MRFEQPDRYNWNAKGDSGTDYHIEKLHGYYLLVVDNEVYDFTFKTLETAKAAARRTEKAICKEAEELHAEMESGYLSNLGV